MSGNAKFIPIAQYVEGGPSADADGFPVDVLKADQFGALWVTFSDPVEGFPFVSQFGGSNLPINANPDNRYLATLAAGYVRDLAATPDVFVPVDRGLLDADAQATTRNAALALGIASAFNSASFDRLGSGSAVNLAAQSSVRAQLVSSPGEWTLTSAPAANTVATATRAAGAAGVRHVLRSIHASINAVAAIAAPLTVVVRDGATGVGTILWQDRLTAPVGTDARISLTGLNIVGTAATAMTVEFTAVPGATNFETLSATGHSAAATA